MPITIKTYPAPGSSKAVNQSTATLKTAPAIKAIKSQVQSSQSQPIVSAPSAESEYLYDPCDEEPQSPEIVLYAEDITPMLKDPAGINIGKEAPSQDSICDSNDDFEMGNNLPPQITDLPTKITELTPQITELSFPKEVAATKKASNPSKLIN